MTLTLANVMLRLARGADFVTLQPLVAGGRPHCLIENGRKDHTISGRGLKQ